jgi:hypothetical protein
MKKLFCAAVALGLLSLAGVASAATPLEIWVDVDGSAFLYNTTGAPISFDGYQVTSETNRLDPAGWKSIADYVAGGAITDVIAALGAGGLTFGEANPGAGNLAELNLGGVGTLQGGAKFAIGKPFLDGSSNDATADFFYKIGGNPNSVAGEIVNVPEPSSLVLGGLGLVGLVGLIRRRRAA